MLKSCLYMHLSLIFLCVTFSTNLDGQTYTRHRHSIPSNWSSTLYETPPIKVVFRSPSLILDVPMDKRPGLRAPLECILHLHLYNLFFSSHGRSFIFLPWTSKIFRVRAPVRIKRKLERAYLYHTSRASKQDRSDRAGGAGEYMDIIEEVKSLYFSVFFITHIISHLFLASALWLALIFLSSVLWFLRTWATYCPHVRQGCRWQQALDTN